jgi:hypothetical protein
VGAACLFEANLKAYGPAHRFAHFFRNAAGGHAGGETARFEYIHVLESGLEESGWNPCGFAGTRFGL